MSETQGEGAPPKEAGTADLAGDPDQAIHWQLLWGSGLPESRLDRELPRDGEHAP